MKIDNLRSQLTETLNLDFNHSVTQTINHFDTLLSEGKDLLVLFGAGRLGKLVLSRLRSINIKPIAFTDNNPDLWGKEIDGLPIISVDDSIKTYAYNAIFVVTIYTDRPVINQLKALGVNPISFPELAWKYPNVFMPYWCLEYPIKIYQQSKDVRECLFLWADDISEREYLSQIRWRITLDSKDLPVHLPQEQIYFPSDIISLNKKELYVDCGAYNGDSIKNFVSRTEGSFEKIVALEPDPCNFQELLKCLSLYSDEIRAKIIARPVAIGSKRGKINFNATGTVESTMGEGNYFVDCIPLDEILNNSDPTYIKMDIEGAELEALFGAKNIISKSLPVLAMSLYHKQEHLWQIPLLIKSISSQYQLFLRRYSDACWELVCYAVPIERIQNGIVI